MVLRQLVSVARVLMPLVHVELARSVSNQRQPLDTAFKRQDALLI